MDGYGSHWSTGDRNDCEGVYGGQELHSGVDSDGVHDRVHAERGECYEPGEVHHRERGFYAEQSGEERVHLHGLDGEQRGYSADKRNHHEGQHWREELHGALEGYEFGGWTLSGDANAEPSTDLTIPQGSTENREYVAHWDIIRYTLSYDIVGGTAENPKSYTIESPDFSLNNPAKKNYKFAGWTGSADVASSMDVTIAHGSIGNRSYTATWGEYTNKYYVHTPDGLSITQSGWNFPAGVITASADAEDFDPAKKVVISVTSPNKWKLKDASFWGWLNSEITFGAQVEDFSAKRPGAYEDNVKFSVEISE